MIAIRHYQESDWPMVDQWWKESGEIGPLPLMMPEESSFIAEIDSTPALAVTIYLTNTPELAYVENYIGNPELKGPKRKEAAKILVEHFCEFAKRSGYRRLVCMSQKSILVDRYKELGFVPSLGGVTTLVRSL